MYRGRTKNRVAALGRALVAGTKTTQKKYLRRSKKNVNQMVLTRTCALSIIVDSNVGADSTLGLAFRLQDLPNYAEFTALFDLYQIRKITICVEPWFNASELTVGLLDSYKAWSSVIDYDDATAPATENEIMEYAKTKRHNAGKMKYISFKPRISQLAFKTGGGTIGYTEGKKNVWCDCTNPDIEHYGFKAYFPYLGIGLNRNKYKITAKYTIGLKDPK